MTSVQQIGLSAILFACLFGPFLVRKIEENLEAFLFILGIAAVTVSGRWSLELAGRALYDPVSPHHPIVEAVLVAGLVFRALRGKIRAALSGVSSPFAVRAAFFCIIAGLGLISSVITAIVAALVLCELVSGLRLDEKRERWLVVLACFSIGLGAAITPVGEPLSTIAIAKLRGEPHNADFWFLLRILWPFLLPAIFALAAAGFIVAGKSGPESAGMTQDSQESISDVFIRTGKVYLFVLALVLLGEGARPVVDAYAPLVPPRGIYWINMVSAILDNATLTAAEITPAMSIVQIRDALMGLLISGGMLIPGNIPNIIAAGKLGITSRRWAVLGVPCGLVLMVVFDVVLFWILK